MSTPSQWPLPDQGIRFLTPAFMLQQLYRHPLTRDCYPTAMGYYPSAAGHRLSWAGSAQAKGANLNDQNQPFARQTG